MLKQNVNSPQGDENDEWREVEAEADGVSGTATKIPSISNNMKQCESGCTDDDVVRFCSSIPGRNRKKDACECEKSNDMYRMTCNTSFLESDSE